MSTHYTCDGCGKPIGRDDFRGTLLVQPIWGASVPEFRLFADACGFECMVKALREALEKKEASFK